VVVISTQVDDSTVMDNDVPNIVRTICGCRIDEAPSISTVVADRQAAIGPDENVLSVVWIDRYSERRGLVPSSFLQAKTSWRDGARMRPSVSSVGADIDARNARNPPIVE
jgi:hypothetical protein